MTLAKTVTTLHEENRLHANQHNNSDRPPQTHRASLGLALKHTQRKDLSNTADSSPSKSHEAFIYSRPCFLFHCIPLYYLPPKLQFPCRQTKEL